VKEVLSFGSHDWIMGEVVAVYLSESPLKKDNAFVGIHGRYFEAKEELNPYGFSISQ
jgi:flavin reductase (DIM6/NTAB) family NADH-FMN oxidoreductase RutF